MGKHEDSSEKLKAEYPGLTPGHIRLMQFYSNPALAGPRITPELAALVRHLFTDEEAEVAQHLEIGRGRDASYVAGKVHRPLEEAARILSRLADEKRALLSLESENKPKNYRLMPLMPGTFEMALMEGKEDEWHKEFGRLYDALYNTGYIKEVLNVPVPFARFIPVERTIEAAPMAIPSDRLAEMIKSTKSLALGVCVCRQARNWEGHEKDLPRETCLTLGSLAEFMITRGIMRRTDQSEAIEIKRRANEAGLATLSINVNFDNPNFSCSCCGDCCVALRSLTQFNTPGIVAPPHFLPVREVKTCTQCQKCVKRCPTKAHVLSDKKWIFKKERCIGCGLCASSCPTKSMTMQPVKNYRRPPADYLRFGLNLGRNIFPGYLKYVLREKKLTFR
ncbi:MAG: 4Fe-4S binding protein [Proteobacteria bacterium]|nr:4Fe-4S binding protein [Pseudomonadota bacterium]